MSNAEIRKIIKEVYAPRGKQNKWTTKVDKMQDAQAVAVYLSFKRRKLVS